MAISGLIKKYIFSKSFYHHPGFWRYFKNASWLFVGQFFSLAASFFIGAWVARYLGPEEYGLVNYVLSFVGLFVIVTALGTDNILNRELVNHPEKRNELLGTCFRLRLLGGLIAFLSIIVAIFLFGEQNIVWRTLVILYSISFFFQAPYVISNYFFSTVQAKKNVQAQFYVTSVCSILKILLILLGGNVYWLVGIYAIDCLCQSFFLILLYRAQGLKVADWCFQPKLAYKIWLDSWPLMLSSAAYFIYLRIDQVIIGRIMNESSVGVYAAAVRIVEILYFIPTIICSSLFPAIINARRVSAELFARRLKYFYLLLGFTGLIVAVVISLLARPLVVGIFGSAYLSSVGILKIYAWSCVGLFLGLGINQQLTVENKTKTIFYINLATMVFNIGLNLFLIPVMGLSGAAVATLISYCVIPVIFLLYLIKG
ncbi:MAG TPA: flippase [bacterium]|nr:flippase [bacterium]